MDIYIVHDGQETGPFSENAARELLSQGGVAETDFAWRTGMEKWIPLSELLAADKPVTPVAGSTPPPPSDGKFEPATPKQKALLSFLGITIPAEMSRDQAARRVNDAMEDSANAERLKLWNEERLRLHPELFAAEIQAKKENRATYFLELCQTTGAKYLSGISKAHCQVLVQFLDIKFPNWDARESEAAEHYFFPAVAEKFPQLVHKQWRGRLRYVEGLKVSPEIVNKSMATQTRRTATSPLAAVVRGVALGLVILAVLYLGYRTMHQDVTAAPATSSATPAPTASSEPSAPAVAPALPAAESPAIAVATTPPEKLPSIDPIPSVAPAVPAASVAPTEPAPATTPTTAVAVPPPAEAPAVPAVPGIPAPPAPAVAVVPDPAMVPGVPAPPAPAVLPTTPAIPDPTAPVAAVPPTAPPPGVPTVPGLPPSPPADPATPMATLPPSPPPAGLPPSPPPPAALPGMTPPADPTVATPPSSVTTAPMATLPGAEPPVPVAPPPATLPVAGMLPSNPTAPAEPAVPGLPPSPPATPSTPSVPGLPPSPGNDLVPPVPAPTKTNLVLTKVVEVQLAYGKIALRPGTAVKLISRQGGMVKVSYGGNVITIPVASTDLE